MKPRISFLLGALLALPALAQARVLTLSNNPQNPGQYATYSAAETAASNGDTIYVHGSSISYNSIVITKGITLIGPGHNPQKQAPLKATFDYIGVNASNAAVIGVIAGYIYTNSGSPSNVTISRNRIEYNLYIQSQNCSNWHIEGNVLGYQHNGAAFNGSNYNFWDFFFDNNVFCGRVQDNYYGNSYNIYFNNCIFLKKNGAPAEVASAVKGLTFNNCIFYGPNPTPYINGGATFYNCISYGAADNSFPAGSGNIVNYDPLFTSYNGNGFAYTDNYTLQAGSPGKNYGLDGADLGLYGGTYVWNQYGMPKLPYISEFTIGNNQVSAGGTLNINFKSSIAQ